MIPVDGNRQECVNLTCDIHAKAYDLPAGVDPMCEQKIQRGVGWGEGIEIHQFAVEPEERARHAARVERHADDFPSVIDAEAGAIGVSGECPEILDASFPGPKEGVEICVTFQVRNTHDLAFIVYF
jgi:hypothetical protein